ncbi:MAG: TIGR00645 family protein, partial [Proteobacteria bacterium]|nr:TIGR00645 family protein [Pseudomonadota bacterium]
MEQIEQKLASRLLAVCAGVLFASRWLLAAMYLGLVLVQIIYCGFFVKEVFHLISHAGGFTETSLLLAVLGLIDIVMIANLILMITLGGYDHFVSNMRLEGHPDRPEWLSHIDASTLKLKLTTALIGISSVHLLKTFVNAENVSNEMVGRQVEVHLMFIVSSFVLARLEPSGKP